MDLILHVLVINWLSILNRIWFSHSLLNSVCFLEEATSLSQQKPFIMPLTSVWAMELILRQSETEYIDLRVRSWIGYQILGQVINRVHTTTQFFWGYLPPPGGGGGYFVSVFEVTPIVMNQYKITQEYESTRKALLSASRHITLCHLATTGATINSFTFRRLKRCSFLHRFAWLRISRRIDTTDQRRIRS